MSLRLVRPPALWHLTLTTGHGRCSPRNEVADDIVDRLLPLVAAGRGTVRDLTISVAPPETGWCWFILEREAEVAAYCVLCWDERGHAEAWREALEHFALAAMSAGGGAEPPVPWLTAEVLAGAVGRTPAELAMLGDAERCVAWAILEEQTSTSA